MMRAKGAVRYEVFMKADKRMRRISFACYIAVAAMFTAFFIYLGIFEKVDVAARRNVHEYVEVTGYDMQLIEDDSAPAGVRKTYTWKLSERSGSDTCLCFYVTHQYVQVDIAGETVYTLTGDPDNHIGRTVSSNWVQLPILPRDRNDTITITLTPVFESMVDFTPQFLMGSHYRIIFDRLRADAPQLFIGVLCMILGVFIIVTQSYFMRRLRRSGLDMIYLGNIALMLGIWRLTDNQSSPLLFPGGTMVMGYISIGLLFLLTVAFQLYASTNFSGIKARVMMLIAMVEALVSLEVLLLQLFAGVEFKQSLSISHVMLVMSLLSVPVVRIALRKFDAAIAVKRMGRYFLLLFAGVMLDLVLFYVTGTSASIICTPLAFVAYTLIVFVTSILDTTRKAYTDGDTGLVNKARWNELMQDNPGDVMTGMVMIDLNNLKQVNDALGHEMGDELIHSFSRLLYTAFPARSVICRWGGDEFTVLTQGKDALKQNACLKALRQSVDRHNERGGIHISYAVGSVHSWEFPGMSRTELMAKADSRMYTDKHNSPEHRSEAN